LYYSDGSQVNDDGADSYWAPRSANEVAYDAATANEAAKQAVEVIFSGGGDNNNDVQRGHWSFGYGDVDRGFTPNPSNVAVDIGNFSEEELDADLDFINAVRVVTRRETSPVKTFFAKIFGQQSFTIQAEAIAYRGFTASLPPGEVDTIIAICAQSIWEDTNGNMIIDSEDKLACNYGRMFDSSGVTNEINTAGWTDFYQPCTPGGGGPAANRWDLEDLLEGCLPRNSEIKSGIGLRTNNGVVMPVFWELMKCWRTGYYVPGDRGKGRQRVADEYGEPVRPWTVTLPVIDCPEDEVRQCHVVLGAITVNIVWMLEMDTKDYMKNHAPKRMFNPKRNRFWKNDSEEWETRWNSFVEEFQLKMPDGKLATTENDGNRMKSIYFLPDCTPSA
jgi:hypothetical protein